ncbi:C20orf194 [Bugula neritina]|uniref:C20orf194 n=1 Tax=Bugula neritina TaxID=10212 RepID=A0A7J7J9C9_BUGNE|nr:C20orf194 [Bugula neritina]
MSRKLSKHSENVSFQRLKNVQKLLKDNSIDCLLCIQGIDSWYNEGMQEFANYLLLDFFDSYRQDLLSTGSEDDILDDLVLCIKTDSVDICCNPINYRLFLPYFAAWPNFRVFCLSESQYGNQESVLEEFKVKSFVSMLSKCKHVAVPYFSKSQLGESTFDKMKVEKWPLIQAYALEGYGRGIFFTLVHDVIDASLLLSEISGRFDAVSTEKLISEQLLIFESQWEGLGKAVDVARLNKFADGFTDADVIESLHTYYRHGTVGVEPRQEEACFWLKPFCFMGLHTQDIVKRNQAGQPIRADILTAGLSSTQALHMICHGVAPKSGFMCTRTYFFDSSALPPPVGSEVEYRKPDVEQLSRAYKAAIEVTLKSIDEYSTSLQHSQVTEKAKKNVVSKLQKFMDCRKLELEVKLETKLFDGRLESAVDGKAPHTIFVMSVIINNIPSCTATGKSLGAVAFSESFLLSTIKYEKVVGGVPGIHSEVLILTQNVPRWQTWNISSEFEELSSTVEQFIDYKSQDNLSDSIGEFLVDGQPIDIISPYAWMQPIPCRLFLYSEAVIVANDSFGTFTLAKESLKSAHFYDGGGRSVPAFVTFYTSLDLQTKLPTQLQNTSRMVVISISPRSKAYKQFFEQVFEAWKRQEGSDFALSMEETLPESLKAIYEKVAASFKLKLSRPLSKVSYHGTSYPEGQLLNHTGSVFFSSIPYTNLHVY